MIFGPFGLGLAFLIGVNPTGTPRFPSSISERKIVLNPACDQRQEKAAAMQPMHNGGLSSYGSD
ncbi:MULTISPECIES: hypothetical protein [unclassified Agrobacterium]|uniref:hypothetical protein n=1 Tax=unclassified Agrobacterium TaxID=2632611 RepID=UPI0009E347BC|nr:MULTISPECIES: hypothetical protein [unclassified Agrobacterium]MCD4660837.1 hypothetical protein [Agrobacterium sp.]